jgi:hypothetical protein
LAEEVAAPGGWICGVFLAETWRREICAGRRKALGRRELRRM